MKRMLCVIVTALVMLCGSEAVAGDATQPSSPSSAAAASPPPKVDINRAGTAELVDVPGIGPQMAQAIVDLRTSRGPFTRLEDLLQVRGIKERTLKALSPYLAVQTPPAAATTPSR